MADKKKKYFSTTKPYARFYHLHLFYRFVRTVGRAVMPRHETIWDELPPEEPAVFTVNHAKAYGPVAMCTSFPRRFRPWVMSDVCFVRTFPAFARKDFWHPKTRFGRGLCRVISYILAPVARMLFPGAEAIPAYFDERSYITIKKSVETLIDGKDIVLFPENRQPFSEYNEDFSVGFIFVARRYYKKTGKRLRFYPVFASSTARTIRVGKCIVFDPAADFKHERERIKTYLRGETTRLGKELGGPKEYDMSTYEADDKLA